MSAVLKITIEEVRPSYFTVTVGDRYADNLCRDEATGLIAAVLWQSQVAPPWLKTAEEHAAEEAAREERRKLLKTISDDQGDEHG